MKKVLFIIPAYNEESNILKTCNCITKYNEKNNTNFDVIVINDGSTDTTDYILKKNEIPHITLINNLGIGGAVQTGYKYAFNNNYDIAIQFDGDGQHDINYAKILIEPIINKEANLVIGSRFIKNNNTFKSTFARRLGIKLISFVIKLITKEKVYDTTSGFRACDKVLIEKFAKDYPIEYPEPITTVETILSKEFKIKEVSVEMKERVGGKSSIRAWKNIYYMINVILSIIMVKIRRDKK